MCVVILTYPTGAFFAWWLAGCGGIAQTKPISQHYIIFCVFIVEDFMQRGYQSIRCTISKCCWVNILKQPWPPHLFRLFVEDSLIFLVCHCGLILTCSRVCCSDIVIMYCNRGTFQALCWLLIGLQCNDCVILMTQIQLIVIFMSCEDCLFSLGLHDAEVYECVCACVRTRRCREQRLMAVYSSSSMYPFVFLKSSYSTCSLASMMWVSPFPNAIDRKSVLI